MMHESRVDVVISGAGPNGLMVACELALGGVHPIVLDMLPEPSAEPKANGLVGQVVRMLDMRGLYHEFTGAPDPPAPIPNFIFSGIPVSFAGLADNPMYSLLIPQPRVVRLLAKRARDLGVEIRWGHELIELAEHDGGVRLMVAGPGGAYELTTEYLVGADGGHSLVRKSVGIGFPGNTTPMVTRIAQVHIPDELRTGDGGIIIPGLGRLPFGHNRLEGGGFAYGALGSGHPVVATMEFDSDPVPDDTPMTLAELSESLRRVLGVDLPFEPPRGPGPHALRRINAVNTRQADRYREGNVLLVGDAAHVHSAMGGPGLNLGLQDVFNLGWKLAATVNGWAPTELLDTYYTERHAVGQRVMMHSMSQTALMAPGPEVAALRVLMGELLAKPDAAAHIAGLLSGSEVRYDVDDSHPLAGRLVPDYTLAGGQRVAELMHRAHPVLLDFTGGAFAESASPWRGRVDVTTADGSNATVAALLIRPDGYVAWAADDCGPNDVDRLRTALQRWFGSARREARTTAAGPRARR
jgi:2-polyprenyl-6-methoxyphenol hydroxylase-like FAD-dependent oxidoreductase